MPEAAQKEFTALHIIAHAERVVGGLLTIAGFVLTLRTATDSWDIKASWVESLGMLALGIATFAFGELILLFLQIERNTRR
ncbi:MAG: hypothetical protein JWQ87_1547 [Candidatus Sulfotelmatobacter sp.]|nr:hypothetical protein [Candidatus Sulfotelmatobacter sp.]